MKTQVIDLLKKRRSIYNIGKNLSLKEEEIIELVTEAVKESPSSFNSQSSRAVILFDEAHMKLWAIVEKHLRSEVPDGTAFEATEAKLNSFRSGYGTVLFFEDETVVKNLQDQFVLYADNFPIWSEQSSGIAAMSVWASFAENNIGASLQHYNPLIDEDVKKEWNLPASWILRAQMPFGSIEAPAGEKEYMDDEERFRVFR